MTELSPLRRRMIEDMTIRNLSPATQRSYQHAVAKFSRHFGRSPDRLGLEDVRAFQLYLVSNGISWPALSQTVCVLRFFYGVTLGHAEIPERIVYARSPRTLPVVLSADEVIRFMETRVISGIIFVIRNGLCGRDALKEYGPHKTINNRFVRWSRLGVFNRIFAELAAKGGPLEKAKVLAGSGLWLPLRRIMFLQVVENGLTQLLTTIGHALFLDHPLPQIIPPCIRKALLLDQSDGVARRTHIEGLFRARTVDQAVEFRIAFRPRSSTR